MVGCRFTERKKSLHLARKSRKLYFGTRFGLLLSSRIISHPEALLHSWRMFSLLQFESRYLRMAKLVLRNWTRHHSSDRSWIGEFLTTFSFWLCTYPLSRHVCMTWCMLGRDLLLFPTSALSSWTCSPMDMRCINTQIYHCAKDFPRRRPIQSAWRHSIPVTSFAIPMPYRGYYAYV